MKHLIFLTIGEAIHLQFIINWIHPEQCNRWIEIEKAQCQEVSISNRSSINFTMKRHSCKSTPLWTTLTTCTLKKHYVSPRFTPAITEEILKVTTSKKILKIIQITQLCRPYHIPPNKERVENYLLVTSNAYLKSR